MSKNSSIASKLKVMSPTPAGITWGPLSAIIVTLVVVIFAEVLGIIVVELYPLANHWSQSHITSWVNSNLGQFIYTILAEGFTVLLVLWYIRWRKGNWRSIGLSKKANWLDLGYTLIGFGIYFISYIVAVGVLSAFIHSLNVSQSQDIGFNNSTRGPALILVFISLVILPPIAEEIVFRGFLFSGLKKKLPLFWAVIVTSLVFASPHLLESQNGGLLWIAGIDTFVLSLVLCWLRQKTGKLYAGMGLHALKNFIAFAALFLVH
jgi:membrane protease YdiL (CAAX protease family)